MELSTLLADTCALARRAGALLMDYYQRPIRFQTKSTATDLTTEADQACEALLSAHLRQAYPDHHIVGEEGGGMGAPPNRAPYFWYIDPLDGTTNFASKIPHFSISIALTDRQQNPLLAIVYDPCKDELFTAIDGAPTRLNQAPISVSQTADLQQALLATGFPYDKHLSADNNLAEWSALLTRARDIRRMGSAALDLAYVACGRFDAFWEQKLKPWDVLAGALLVRMAGGQVTDYARSEVYADIGQGHIIASNGRLHTALLDIIDAARRRYLRE